MVYVSGWIVEVDASNKDKIIQDMLENYKNYKKPIILESKIQFKGPKDNKLSWSDLDQLYKKIVACHKKEDAHNIFFMGQGILPTRLLTEHPCNAYVCKGHTCHSSKRDIGRKLYINPLGAVYPETEYLSEDYAIGNLKDNTLDVLLESYFESEQHEKFRKLVKEIFLQYVQSCPYRVVPWRQIFTELSASEGMMFSNDNEQLCV